MSEVHNYTTAVSRSDDFTDIGQKQEALRQDSKRQTTSVEDEFQGFIKSIYTPGDAMDTNMIARAVNSYSYDSELPEDLPASLLAKMKMQDAFVRPADSYSSYYGSAPATGRRHDAEDLMKPLPKFTVYQPKQSSQYYSILNQKRHKQIKHDQDNKSEHTERWVNGPGTNRYSYATPQGDGKSSSVLIDYKNYANSQHKPVSRHLYSETSGLRSSDTRYVGTNFAIITMRQPDAWYGRVDKLLAEARKPM